MSKLRNCELNCFILNCLFALGVLGFAVIAPCLGSNYDVKTGIRVHADGSHCHLVRDNDGTIINRQHHTDHTHD